MKDSVFQYMKYLEKREELIGEGIPYPAATEQAWEEVYQNKVYPLN